MALNPEYRITQYVHTSWKSESGLQAVRRLKQTPDGYLWLATRGGLVRFDGVRFTTYRAGSVPGLESSTMQDLLVDPDGSFWVATLGGGVSHFREGEFHSYTSRDGLPSDDIGSLYRDSHGVMWMGTRDGKVGRRVQDRFETLPLAIPVSPVTAFAEDADQSLWIATFGNGVYRLRDGKITRFSVRDGLPDARVAGLYRDRSGKVWTTGWGGVSFWNGARFVSDPTINRAVGYVVAVNEDRNGNFWIAASSGLFRVESGRVSKIDRDSGLSDDFVSDVFEDREGNLWAGTRGGLDRFRDGLIRTFTNREGLIRDSGPIVAAGHGAVWTVSPNQIARIAASEVAVWNLKLPPGRRPFTILPNDDSQFLIGFEGGGIRWNGIRAETAPELAGLDVRCLLQARDGSLWIATADRGLLHWKTNKGTRTWLETGVSDKLIVALAEDRNGAIWAGSLSSGLFRVTGQRAERFGRNEGFHSLTIYTLFVDSAGSLWIGSTNGLSWFEDGQLRTVNSQQGLPSDQVFAIIDDAYGRLWFSGFGGIASIDRTSLTEWSSGRRHRLTPTVYRSADGLHTAYTVGRMFPNAIRTDNGHLWFSTADGVSEVTPPNLDQSRSQGFQVVVEKITADGVSSLPQDRLRIPPGTRAVELGYTALTLSSPETVRFRYRLEGIDPDWVDAESRRTAFYNNLKPGGYRFRVSASATGEEWREASAVVLEQLPFFYQTGWFLALAVTGASSLAFIAYRIRVQRAVDRIHAGLRERMAERTRIAQELHDTVVQAISGSTMLVENAAEKVPDSLPVLKGTLLRALDRLDVALAESRAALKGLRESTCLENDLEKQLTIVADDANHHGIGFKLVVTGELRALRPMIQYEVLRVGSEAICNAFNHANATSIRVDLAYGNGLRLSVKDNGRGIPAEVLDQGKDGHFGLQGLHERADRMGAKLAVYSRAGDGAEVCLVVPEHIAFDARSEAPSRLARTVSRLRTLGRSHFDDGLIP